MNIGIITYIRCGTFSCYKWTL